MRIMQVLGLTTLLGSSTVSCSDDKIGDADENLAIVKYQPNTAFSEFNTISSKQPNIIASGVCGVQKFWQQQADIVAFEDAAERIYKLGYESGKAGENALSKESIEANVITLLDNAMRGLLHNVRAAKKSNLVK